MRVSRCYVVIRGKEVWHTDSALRTCVCEKKMWVIAAAIAYRLVSLQKAKKYI